MAAPPIGFRLRDLRKKKGITQTDLAKSAGISVSYLNLIEHDRRTVGGALLNRLAGILEVEIEQISTHQDACHIHDLVEMAGDPLFRESNLEAEGAQTIVGRQPNWGRGILKLYHAYLAAKDASEALSARLHSDPFLTDAKHRILSLITSIRSFSEILNEYSDLSAEERQHFVSVVAVESTKLGSTARSLFDFINEIETRIHPSTPANEVNDFIIDHGNYFPELEEAADDLRKRLMGGGGSIESKLDDYLTGHHRIQFRHDPVNPGTTPGKSARFRYNAKDRILTIDEALPEASTRFLLAQFLFDLEFEEVLRETVDHPTLTSDEARRRAHQAMARYGAGALLFPYDEFLEEAESRRYDIQLLSCKFNGSFEQVCHRLVTLRNPSASGIPLAFLRVDPAGNVSKRFNLPSLRMPSHIGACPLWAAYRAFQSPEQILTQLVQFPNNDTFVFVARTVLKRTAAFGSMPRIYSVMIAFSAIHANRTVYGADLDPIRSKQVIPVGTNCRLCPRDKCQHRAYSSAVAPDTNSIIKLDDEINH